MDSHHEGQKLVKIMTMHENFRNIRLIEYAWFLRSYDYCVFWKSAGQKHSWCVNCLIKLKTLHNKQFATNILLAYSFVICLVDRALIMTGVTGLLNISSLKH